MLHIPRLSTTTRALALSAAAVITPVVLNAQVPTGWQAITDASGEYTVRADGARRDGGQGFAGATIKANVASPRGSALLAQSIRADAYRGKRVRLSGYLKTIGVNEGTAVLFMRIDGDGIVQTSESFMASAASPTMTGVIGLSLMPVLKPSACRPLLKKRVLSHSRSMS